MSQENTEVKYPKYIVKRDQTLAEFDVSKISKAMSKAFAATGTEVGDEELSKIADAVVNDLQGIYELSDSSDVYPTVENCQDSVEDHLMKFGHYSVAKKYVLYRAEHQRIRDMVVPEEFKKEVKEAMSYFDSPYNYLVYLRTYARFIDEKGRRETWLETVTRFSDFMRSKVGDKFTKEEYQELHDAILNMEVVPSMRMLQFSGKPVEMNEIAAYNCSYIAPTRLVDFHDILCILFHGAGVGFSCENKYVSQLPIIAEQTGEKLERHIVEDSREGWCRAFLLGLETWYGGKDISFDYSLVRPAGARLKTFGGYASGPRSLRELLVFSRQKILSKQGGRLRSIDVHDIICKIGEIVVAGGVRRSSLISLSDLDDDLLRHAKQGNFWIKNNQRNMSNNSAVYNEKPSDEQLLEEWNALVQSGTGERGIFNRGGLLDQLPQRRLDKIGDMVKHMGTNPCLTSEAVIDTIDGPKTVKELIGKKVDLIVDGERKKMLSNGFFHTGKKDVYFLRTIMGEDITATENHPFFVIKDGKEVKTQLKDLRLRDILIMKDGEQDELIEMSYVGEKVDVYDVTVEDHVFVANNFKVGNCGEILLQPRQFCNLTSAVLRSNDTAETIKRKIRLASILGTYQSMLTNFKTISPEWKTLAEMERLLGVSMTGIMDCPYLIENIEILDELRELAVATNKIYAEKLGINQSTCVTTIKPSGNSSQTLNTASGMHARFSKYYIRRVRISSTDPLAKMLIDQGVPYHPENGQTRDNASTWVFEFPIKSPEGSVYADNLSAIDQLNFWREMKCRWCEHNPSCTIYVRKDEWMKTLEWIKENWSIVGGLSFLPLSEHVYTLAPYEKITEEEYNKLCGELPDVDFSKLILYEKSDKTERKQQWACTAAGGCEF